MARPTATIAVALLALLLIHGVASLPDATAATNARRLQGSHSEENMASVKGHHHRRAARKLHQHPHPPMMTTGVDAALGGAKKLLGAVDTAASGGKRGKRQLLDDATRTARVLTDYACDYDYC
jgi:hypothetical protein